MAIIGISGKIGSGKDTIGRIIQYFTMVDFKTMNLLKNEDGSKVTFEQHFLNNVYLQSYSNWKIKKFADCLKECASLILNISREDLEKIEVKNSELPEEWNKISAGWIPTYSNPDNFSHEESAELIPITVRQFLQLFGTEVGRAIHPNFWVNALFSGYKNFHTDKFSVRQGINEPEYPNWIITDMRFPNELEAIKSRGGITIRVNRSLAFAPANGKGVKKHIENNQHPSETALDNAIFDHIIDNNNTIEELIVKVKEILVKEKII